MNHLQNAINSLQLQIYELKSESKELYKEGNNKKGNIRYDLSSRLFAELTILQNLNELMTRLINSKIRIEK